MRHTENQPPAIGGKAGGKGHAGEIAQALDPATVDVQQINAWLVAVIAKIGNQRLFGMKARRQHHIAAIGQIADIRTVLIHHGKALDRSAPYAGFSNIHNTGIKIAILACHPLVDHVRDHMGNTAPVTGFCGIGKAGHLILRQNVIQAKIHLQLPWPCRADLAHHQQIRANAFPVGKTRRFACRTEPLQERRRIHRTEQPGIAQVIGNHPRHILGIALRCAAAQRNERRNRHRNRLGNALGNAELQFGACWRCDAHRHRCQQGRQNSKEFYFAHGCFLDKGKERCTGQWSAASPLESGIKITILCALPTGNPTAGRRLCRNFGTVTLAHVPPMRTGIYPGTFDPITFGHFDIIQRATRLVDRLVIGVARHSGKDAAFTVEERIGFIAAHVKRTGAEAEILIYPMEGLLIDFVRQCHATVIFRGLRAVADFDYEFQMAMMNARLAPEIETVFLMASETNQFIASRLVKEVARLGGDITTFVPPEVAAALQGRAGALISS